MTHTVIVLLADGFEESEAIVPIDYMRRAGFDVTTASVTGKREVTGSHSIVVVADTLIAQTDPKNFDAVVIPGGLPGAETLRDSKSVNSFVEQMAASKKLVAAICAGPIVLEKAGLFKGGTATCYPGFEDQLSIDQWVPGVHVGDGIITAEGPALAPYLAYAIIEYLDASKLDDLRTAVLEDDMMNWHHRHLH